MQIFASIGHSLTNELTDMTDKTRKPSTGGVLIGSDYDVARTRKMEADAAMAEIELQKAQKLLVRADDVEKVWSTILFAVRAKLLAIPSKSAPVLALETDVAIIKDILDNAVGEALTELSAYDPAVDPVALTGGDGGAGDILPAEDGAAPETKPKRVGRPKKGARLTK
jgi:hypothetical protein